MWEAGKAWALTSGFLSPLLSYHLELPWGLAIGLLAELAYLASVSLARAIALRALYVPRTHSGRNLPLCQQDLARCVSGRLSATAARRWT